MKLIYDIIREYCLRLINERLKKIEKLNNLNLNQIRLHKEERYKLSDEINRIRLSLKKINEGMCELFEIDK